MTTRRSFIQQSALLSAGLIFSKCMVLSKQSKKIGLQLYTLREQIVKDVKGVIEKVAQAGYSDVETYGYTKEAKYWGIDPKAFSELLKNNNLTSSSGHYGFDQFITTGKDDELKTYIEAAKIVGQEYITVPWLAEEARKTADDFKAIADKLNKAALICKSSGLKLGYHNHDFEFKQLDNGVGYDILLQNTDPSLVKFELDLYWAVRAGRDPVKLFKQYPGRFTLWHVKDMDKTNPKINTEVGSGSINFKDIFAKAKLAGVDHIFMEQENFSKDPFVSITQSRNYIKNELI